MENKKSSLIRYEIVETEDGYYGFIEAGYDKLGKYHRVSELTSLQIHPITLQFDADVLVFPDYQQETVTRAGVKCKFVTEIPSDKEKLEYLKDVCTRAIKMFHFFLELQEKNPPEIDENGEAVYYPSAFEDPRFPKGYMDTLGGRYLNSKNWLKMIKGEEGNGTSKKKK